MLYPFSPAPWSKLATSFLGIWLALPFCAFAEHAERIAPTSGKWKGHEPGTWLVIRTSKRTPGSSKPEEVTFYKEILEGEDPEGAIHVQAGMCTPEFRFKKIPFSASTSPQKVDKADEVEILQVTDKTNPDLTYEILKETRTTESPRTGKQVSITQRLKQHPDLVLAYRRETNDQLRGETFHYIEEEILDSIETVQRLGKPAIEIRTTYLQKQDGRTMVTGHIVRYVGFPFMESTKEYRNLEGQMVSIRTREVAGFGVDLIPTPSQRSRPQPSRSFIDPKPGSPFYEANIKLFKEMELPEAFIEARMPSMEDYDRLEAIVVRVQPAWEAYQKDVSAVTKQNLLNALKAKYSDMDSVAHPEAEALLNRIRQTEDPDVAGQALALLTSFCPFRYVTQLEAHILEHQIANPDWVFRIGVATQEVPVQIWKQVPLPTNTLPRKVWDFSPAETVIPLKLKQLEQLGSPEDLVLGYDDDRIRDHFRTQLTSEVPKGIIEQGKVRNAIDAAGVYNFPESSNILATLLEELAQTAKQDPQDPEGAIYHALFTHLLKMKTLQSLVDLQKAEANKAVIKYLKQDPESLVALSLAFKNNRTPGPLLKLAPHLPKLTPEEITNARIQIPFQGNQDIPITLEMASLLFTKPFMQDVNLVLSTYLPFYDPDHDYREDILAQQKRWYKRKMNQGKAPWNEIRSEDREVLLTDVLPTYGEEGYNILKGLMQFPGYRKDAMLGLVKTGVRRKETIALIRAQKRPQDPSHRPNPQDLTLWVLGDTSLREEMEAWLKFRNIGFEARELLPYLDREYLNDLATRIDEFRKPNRFYVALGLSKYNDREAWKQILEIWPKETHASHHLGYGRLFNDAAEKNFGQDRKAMEQWVQTLPEYSAQKN